MIKPTLQNELNSKIEKQNSKGMRHQEDPLPSGMKAIIMKENTEEQTMNPDGPHHKEDHLHLGIKISFLDIVILVEILDTRQSIVESMKGITMQTT